MGDPTGPGSVLSFAGVTKRYGARLPALDSLDLEVPAGVITGLLGPNGAGKTTALRIALGLSRADSGSCRLLGVDVRQDLAAVIDRVGCTIEEPGFFGRFSGRLGLELLADRRGVQRARVDVVLDQVGLADRADDRFATYSQGMRQRLGLGAALLKDPDVLLLDEPGNGLDPIGLAHLREVLRSLVSVGKTVLVSSHQLAEVEVLCDEVAVMVRGRCVAQEPVGAEGTAADLVVAIASVGRAIQALSTAGFDVVADDGGRVVVRHGADRGAQVAEALAFAGLFPSRLVARRASLEQRFVELVDPSDRAPAWGGA